MLQVVERKRWAEDRQKQILTLKYFTVEQKDKLALSITTLFLENEFLLSEMDLNTNERKQFRMIGLISLSSYVVTFFYM